MMEQDESFGIIPLRKSGNVWEVLLVQHKHGRYWGFPKGHAEPGETPIESATRELKEETNLEVVQFLQQDPITERYCFTSGTRRISKQVFYYMAVVAGDLKLQAHEIQNALWIQFPDAIDQATHPEAKSILLQVENILRTL